METRTHCPDCGESLHPDAHFCEACGHDLAGPAVARIITSAHPPAACTSCDGTAFTDQGDSGSYCDNCGVRRPAAAPAAEADLTLIAAASDIGKRHHNNEDGFGIARCAGALAAVVCDGVSSSTRPDTASHPAADAAIRTLLRMLDSTPDHEPDGALAEAAMVAAVGAAQAAASAAGSGGTATEAGDHRRAGTANPPSTTYVSAVVTADAVTVGWVGDSRAYWLGDNGSSACLTVDDTLGGQLAAAGVKIADDAPNAAALIRWLGADATDTVPHVAAFQPESSGRVIVCSDGLYRYAAAPEELAAATPAGAPIEVVRHLVNFALEAGGGDNVTVVVLPYPPQASEGSSS
jgi:serine/threonine protein phosphatase PrpC